MNKAAAQALSLTDPILFGQRKRTVDLASEYKLPAVHFIQDLSKRAVYGPSDVDLFRRAAGYVDRIVKGAKPAELPVEQPTKFELTFNLKTAKALGLTVPQ
ncbi:MAG: ABC transporter substrate binding protein, partial [Pseudolabrys sp.]